MKQKTTYWVCQLAGWLGMVLIEMSNYTFFILRKFDSRYLMQFSLMAITGIMLTHGYRYYLKRIKFFGKPRRFIWFFAFVSTVVLSVILSFIFFLPTLIATLKGIIEVNPFIDFIGYVYNWMRYFGVWIIIYFLFKILQQNHKIQQEKLLIENTARTAELELLKAQLNPHFLFNALNSIKALVTINPEQSRDAIVKLSELLRFTLQYNKEQEIPLQEEISEVKKYLELERLRFGERLLVVYDLAEDALNCMLPPAILLTLAENAVKHGITQSIKPGSIIIKAWEKDAILYINMSNTGVYHPGEQQGIGLLHIRCRLEELYGTKAVLNIENEHDQVIATLKIPQ